jgi:hypothetical protein
MEEQGKRWARKAPGDLVRVGLVVGPASHSYDLWGEKMNPHPGSIRTTGMLLTHVWSLRPPVAQRFQEKFPGVQIVKNREDLIGKVDGVYLDDVDAVSLYPLMARPFLEARVPLFVNRPFATSLEKGQAMVDLAQQHHTPLLSASTWEFTESVGDLRAKVAEMKEIKGYVAHNSMSDYYSHGLHGVWYIHAVLQEEMEKGRGRVLSASYLTRNWRTPNGLVVFEHESPTGSYYGALQCIAGADGQAYMRVFGDVSGDAEGKIPGRPGYFQYNTWNALPLVIQEMFETGQSPQTGAHLMEKLTMFLLPFLSVLERNGEPAYRQELLYWELPPPSLSLVRDGQPTDSMFRDPYTEDELKAAEKMLA